MRRFAAASVAAALFSPMLVAQAPNQLEHTRQLLAVASQKAEADAKLALRDADRLAKADVPAAIAKLKEGLAAVEVSQALDSAKKDALVRVFKDRIRVVQIGPDSPAEIAARAKAEEQRKAGEKETAAKLADEQKKVKIALADIAKLRKEGKAKEADKATAELTQKHPESLAVQLLTGRAGFEKATAENEKSTKESEQAFIASIRDVDKTATPTTEDVTFPKDWKERTAKRTISGAPTPEEAELLRSLETKIEPRYKNSRLQDVMDHISTTINRAIIFDTAAMAEAAITYDTPINFSMNQPISARMALRRILGDMNFAYVVRDGVIHVTTPSRARDLMTTKVYYLGDLVMGIGPYGGAPTIGMNLDSVQLVQNVTAIVEMITSAVDPMSWEKRGGIGHLGVNLPTLSLTVRQSQEVHVMLRASLYGKK